MKSKRLTGSENFVGYMFLLPWLVGFFVLTLYPMVTSLYYSFTQFNLFNPPKWIGLDNYVHMFTKDATYLTSLKVTFAYVFLSVPLKLAFALIVAVIMNRKLRFIGLYRTIYYIPTLLGGSIAIAVLWKKLFGGDGVVNSIIFAITGLEAPSWVADPRFAMHTLVLLTVWQFGSSMIIFLAGLKQIPQDYYEAASVDGATGLKKFFYITLPCLSPIILFNLVMQTISAFQAFTQAFILSDGKGGPLDSTMFYTLYLYLEAFPHKNMGYASAMAWVLLLIIAIFTVIIFKTSDSWVSYGNGD